ncbi:MAG: endo-1,4-beta-xylanase [Oscillospiraceae bacterium]|nr:endo-1,4-beta-xylanase [Oscillospiraceae bacterium]MCL2279957.1 endo-1,4-beta-xylanase [Oscillospiraceae bacterium]
MSKAYTHRMGSERIQITDAGGPVTNSEVTLRQVKGSVSFGCAAFETINTVNGLKKGDEMANAKKVVENMLDIFDFFTLPFYWGRFEPERGKPMTRETLNAARWLQERGRTVKGHPLCWHTVCADWLLEFSDEEILRQQLERIERDVTDFRGVIDIWDVINEVVIMPVFDRYDNAVTRICKMEGQIGLVKKVFDEARRANPDALLLINDFDMSTDYSDLVKKLLDEGVCIDAIGLQSHMHQGIWPKEKTLEVLERFSKFGLPLHFTEISLVSGDLMPPHIGDLNDFVPAEWPSTPEGLERQAEQAAEFYSLLFACPLVEAVTYWSFADGGWLNAPAGLVTKEGQRKPAYDTLYDLIHKQWRTPEAKVKTDENGYVEVKGFRGDYVAEFDGGSMEFTLK